MRSSRGWAILMERLKADVLDAAVTLGTNPRMPIEEVHYRRGAIFATTQMASALDAMILSKENDLLLMQSHVDEIKPNATA